MFVIVRDKSPCGDVSNRSPAGEDYSQMTARYKSDKKSGDIVRSKLNGRIYFEGRFFRVFDRGQNNCYFDSAVKNTNMPQNNFLQHRLVLTGTIGFFFFLFFSFFFFSFLFFSFLFFSFLFFSLLFFSFLFFSFLFFSFLFFSILFYSSLFYSFLLYRILFFLFLFCVPSPCLTFDDHNFPHSSLPTI